MRFRTLTISLALHNSFYSCLAAPRRCIWDESRIENVTTPDAVETHTSAWPASSTEPALPAFSEPATENTFQAPFGVSSRSISACPANIAVQLPSPVFHPRSQMIMASRTQSTKLPLGSHISFYVRIADKEQRGHLRRRSENVEHRRSVAIAFGILGSLIGVAALILCGRSIRNYCRMPRRDPVAEHIDRFHLERELAEIEEARLLRVHAVSSRAVLDGAPPTYQEVPRYEEAAKDVPPPFHGGRQAD